MNKLQLIDLYCLEVSRQEKLQTYLQNEIENSSGGFSLAVNAEKLIRASEDLEFRQLASSSKYPLVDGVGAQLVSLVLYGKRLVKINLPSMVLKLSHERGFKVFLLGAEEKVNKSAAERISVRYSNIKIVGRKNGFYRDDKIVEDLIGRARPQIVLLCLGTPKQEYLAHKLSILYPEMTFICCGGALDVFAGNVRRAPEIVQKSGFEWLYRLIQNPKRLSRQRKLPFLFVLLIKRLFQ